MLNRLRSSPLTRPAARSILLKHRHVGRFDHSTKASLSPKIIEHRLLDLIDKSQQQKVMLAGVCETYKLKYKEALDYKALNFSKFKKLIASFSSMKLKKDTPAGGLFLSRSAMRAAKLTKKKPKANKTVKYATDETPQAAKPTKSKAKAETVQCATDEVPQVDTGDHLGSLFLSPSVHTADRTEPKAWTFEGAPGKVTLVDNVFQLSQLRARFPFLRCDALQHDDAMVALDCEGVKGKLCLIQVATRDEVFVFDCVKLGELVVGEFLLDLLTNDNVIKLFHDLHKDAVSLVQITGIPALRGVVDAQLAMELLTGHLHMGFNRMLEELDQPELHATKATTAMRSNGSGAAFAERPLPAEVLAYAADDVRLLVNASSSLRSRLGEENWAAITRASEARARSAVELGGARRVCFDAAKSSALSSHELLDEIRPGDILQSTPFVVANEASTLIDLLPVSLAQSLAPRIDNIDDLHEVMLDKGQSPAAWVGKERILLGGDDAPLVETADIDAVVAKVGNFGSDNRAGLEGQLHRISAIVNRSNAVIGLTMRVGRHVSGNAFIISDLLFAHPNASILILGEPGSGKTTFVREVTRLLAERVNVCIVDTSNEIAGDGDVSHPCVGNARRMMVPSLDRQCAVMIECVQNHTPAVMVIDEIGRAAESEAAQTCKNRGVRLIASAHGNLRTLVENRMLRGLVGGVERVTIGDAQARMEAKQGSFKNASPEEVASGIQKTRLERAGPPTFELIVELQRGKHHECRVILNSAGFAVDQILAGHSYPVQHRRRDPDTGSVCLTLGSE